MTRAALPLDNTHDARATSWVTSANAHADFPLQNLPFGIYSHAGQEPRAGVAIGDQILDLTATSAAGLFSAEALEAAQAAQGQTLNAFMAIPAAMRQALRRALFSLLSTDSVSAGALGPLLQPASNCTMHVPARIGDYTDFFAGIHHARNVGKMFRPDSPLLPNYKYVPVGYHGRSSSILASGTPVHRPRGQRKTSVDAPPVVLPSEKIDFELELGIWIGEGNELGQSIPIGEARAHIAGFCLLNDWSARDIQTWEYQPLGPFLAKNFGTTISPWVITPEALAPFFTAPVPRPAGDPEPLPYLSDADDQSHGALDITCEVLLRTVEMAGKGMPAHRLTAVSSKELYWTFAQLVAHHTSGGCNLQPGDLLGTGTISGPSTGSLGSLLEITENGRRPMSLPSGETRTFLEDGDEIVIRGRAQRPGFASVGFGECVAKVLPSF